VRGLLTVDRHKRHNLTRAAVVRFTADEHTETDIRDKVCDFLEALFPSAPGRLFRDTDGWRDRRRKERMPTAREKRAMAQTLGKVGR
jgi:hypothetical protein